MLSRLYVRNYALIEEQELLFAPGFTVLTGETGAGKSILLNAFQLVLGQRADPEALRNKQEKCVVEAEFRLGKRFAALFEALDMDFEEHCLIRREIHPAGRSRAFVNDSPVLLDHLKALSAHLVEIHSQHDQLLIHEHGFQMDLLDLLLTDRKVLEDFRSAWIQHGNSKATLRAFEQEMGTEAADPDYLKFLLEELDAHGPRPGELAKLESRSDLLSNAEQILSVTAQLIRQLDQDDSGPLGQLGHMEAEMNRLSSRWPDAEPLRSKLSLIAEELSDWRRELENALTPVENDPQVLKEVDGRLNAYQGLFHKHKLQTEDQLIELQSELRRRIDFMESGAERLDELRQALVQSEKNLEEKADVLHAERLKLGKHMEAEIRGSLEQLEMPRARLNAVIERKEGITERGADRLVWMFSANPGSDAKELKKVGSGGELSRVMLALKSMIARHQELPTVLFDEIDSGISGKAAARMAEALRDLGGNMQLLAITHLPQVAASGQQHWRVRKDQENDRTRTSVQPLSDDERIEEIARLMSSEGITEAARAQARELLAVNESV